MAGLFTGEWKATFLTHPNRAPHYRRRPLSTVGSLRLQTPRVGCKQHNNSFPDASCGARFRYSWRRRVAEEAVGGAEVMEEEAVRDGGSEEDESVPESTSESEPALPIDAIFDKAQDALKEELLEKACLDEMSEEIREEFKVLSANLAAAQENVASLEGEIEEQQNKYLRLNADFDNFRKRSNAEKQQLKESATADIVLELLPMLDNFELARQQVVPANEGEEKVNNSYQSLYKQTVDILKGLGVEVVKAKGELFNPEVHEAIMREPNDELPDGTVLEEFRRGFLLKEKLLRAAMVKVAYTDTQADSSESDTREDSDVVEDPSTSDEPAETEE